MLARVLLAITSSAYVMASSGAHAESNKNRIVNGSFETGDFTGWNYSAREEYDIPYVAGAYPEAPDGMFVAGVSTIDYEGYFGQSIEVTPGLKYRLTFWIRHHPIVRSQELCGEFYQEYLCDTAIVFIGRSVFESSGGFGYDWQKRTIHFLAEGNYVYLGVSGNTPHGHFYEFDNFQLGVPEPTIWGMFIAGFGLVGTSLRRARNKQVA